MTSTAIVDVGIAVLRHVNASDTPEALVAAIADDPDFGPPSANARGLSMHQARALLEARARQPGGQFASLQEVFAVRGIGADTAHDILYTAWRAQWGAPDPLPTWRITRRTLDLPAGQVVGLDIPLRREERHLGAELTVAGASGVTTWRTDEESPASFEAGGAPHEWVAATWTDPRPVARVAAIGGPTPPAQLHLLVGSTWVPRPTPPSTERLPLPHTISPPTPCTGVLASVAAAQARGLAVDIVRAPTHLTVGLDHSVLARRSGPLDPDFPLEIDHPLADALEAARGHTESATLWLRAGLTGTVELTLREHIGRIHRVDSVRLEVPWGRPTARPLDIPADALPWSVAARVVQDLLPQRLGYACDASVATRHLSVDATRSVAHQLVGQSAGGQLAGVDVLLWTREAFRGVLTVHADSHGRPGQPIAAVQLQSAATEHPAWFAADLGEARLDRLWVVVDVLEGAAWWPLSRHPGVDSDLLGTQTLVGRPNGPWSRVGEGLPCVRARLVAEPDPPRLHLARGLATIAIPVESGIAHVGSDALAPLRNLPRPTPLTLIAEAASAGSIGLHELELVYTT